MDLLTTPNVQWNSQLRAWAVALLLAGIALTTLAVTARRTVVYAEDESTQAVGTAKDEGVSNKDVSNKGATRTASSAPGELGETSPESPGAVVREAPDEFWGAVSGLLHDHPLILCFLIIACGMGFGAIRVVGITFGTAGVLFAGLLFGHFGEPEQWQMPNGIGEMGLVLFVYSVGLGAGPTFFRAFRDQGRQLAFLGLATVVIGACAIWTLTLLFDVPGELATGIFAGSMTSTPALAAGMEAADPSNRELVSIGYGMAYPVGVAGVVLFVQFLPKLLRVDMAILGDDMQRRRESRNHIDRFLVRISNPALFGRKLNELRFFNRWVACVAR